MSKLQLTLTSLVAVLPAGFLVLLLVSVLLSHSQNLSTIAFVVLGMTMISAGATVAIPVTLWVGGRGKPKLATAKVPTEKRKAADSGDIESVDEDIEELDGDEDAVEASSGSYDVEDALGESSDFDLSDSDEVLTDDNDMELDEDTEPVDDFEDFDLEEEEEQPPPKKKKK